MTNPKQVVRDTVNRVAETTDAGHAIKDNSQARRATTLPPHLQGLGINTNAAQKPRDANAETDRRLSSIPLSRNRDARRK